MSYFSTNPTSIMEEQAREKWFELSLGKIDDSKDSFDSEFYKLKERSLMIPISDIGRKIGREVLGNLYESQYNEVDMETKYIYLNKDEFGDSSIWIGDDRNCISVAKKIKTEIANGNNKEDLRRVKFFLKHIEPLRTLHLFVKKLDENKYEIMEGQHRIIAFVISEIEKVKVWVKS